MQQTKRITDRNGWLEVRDNPLSKVGVFPYRGSEIGAPVAKQIYRIYRPAEELASPECIESFRLLPFVDEHAFLGSEEGGGTPAERKGIQGMIGEQIYFDAPYLRGNLKIVSEAAKHLIDNGKIELSAGYFCQYDFTPGEFEGVPYDAVQRHIRGNHLALVSEGRSGPDVAVQDHLTFTLDSAELLPMADDITGPEGGDNLARIKALLEQLKPLLESQAEANALLAEVGLITASAEPEPTGDTEGTEPVIDENPVGTEPPSEQPTADQAILRALDGLGKRLGNLEQQQRGMDAALVTGLADRDALAANLSGFVGTFDHARMSVQGVAEYGVQKLGVPTQKGQELASLRAYLHGRTPPHKIPTVALDGADVNLFDTWEK
jgi:hypothetical protein